MNYKEISLNKNLFAFLVIVIVVIALRIPTFFEPIWYTDEALSLTVARSIRNGVPLYRGIHDNKPPLFYWLLSLSPTLLWAKTVAALCALGASVLLFKLAREKLGYWAALGGALFAGVFLSIPLLEGHIANGELFMVFPTVAGIYFGWQALKSKNNNFWVLSGVSFALATLIKIPAVFDFAAYMFAVVLFFLARCRETRKMQFKGILLVALGFLLPWSFVGLYFFLQGTWRDAVFSIFTYNFKYVSEGVLLYPKELKKILPVVLLGVPAVIFSLWGFLRSKAEKGRDYLSGVLLVPFGFLWFCYAFFGAMVSGRPYTHYLLQAVPALSFLFAVALSNVRRLWRVGAVLCVLLFFLAKIALPFYRYPTVPYYSKFLRYALGDISKEHYYKSFGAHVEKNYKSAEIIKKYSQDREQLFVWGDDPALYYLSGRMPATKFFLYYHLTAAGQEDVALQEVTETPPRIIVRETNLPQLPRTLTANYDMVAQIDNLVILKRRF